MQEELTPTHKSGYLDVKQPSKMKGRKLKTWKRRWVALTLLNDLSRGGKPLAKLDLFETKEKWERDSSDRVTFILDNVSSIRESKSKTHPHALEIVERLPVLVLSGADDYESFEWTLTLQLMLVPSEVEKRKETFQVTVIPNTHSVRCGLAGQHTMNVTTKHIELINTFGVTTINWNLSTLVRFKTESTNVLTIECGPNSPTGQGVIRLSCEEAGEGLRSIRLCIRKAMLRRAEVRQQHQNSAMLSENSSIRARTNSASVSEKRFLALLDNTALALRSERSDSDSSGASMPFQVSFPLASTPAVSPSCERTSIGQNGDCGVGDFGLGGELMFLEESGLSENSSVNALLRNNSQGSMCSISPVILRHGCKAHDAPQSGIMMAQSIQQNSSPGMGDSPTENAAIGGSPSNRSKRSFDSMRISNPELEAVPEKDENSEGFIGNHVTRMAYSLNIGHNIRQPLDLIEGGSLRRHFDQRSTLPLGNHKRYSSLPVTDSGYSVIKDVTVSSVSRERAATVSNNYSEIAHAVTLYERASAESDLRNVSLVHDPKVEPQYQEIDKKEDPYSTIGPKYIRRRSSSLSDLQTVKYSSKTPHFENVYEDVDELKETLKKLMLPKEEPPELPARPLSVSFSVSLQQSNQSLKPRSETLNGISVKSIKKKRSLFNKHKQDNVLDVRANEQNLSQDTLPKVCICKPPNAYTSLPLAASFNQCLSCGGSAPRASNNASKMSISLKSNLRRAVSSSTEELIHGSDSSSFSELYADIVELRANQGKRRRSSDITPVIKSWLDVNSISPSNDRPWGEEVPNRSPVDSFNGKESTLERASAILDDQEPPALPRRKHSPPSQPWNTVGDLIQLVDGMDKIDNSTIIPDRRSGTTNATPSSKASPHQPPQASDPLISFFLDDKMFQENPMVTGILPVPRPLVLPQTLTSNNNSFPKFLDSLPTSKNNPFSTASHDTNIRDSNNNSSVSSSPLSPSFVNLNDIQANESSISMTNPFTEDSSLWRQTETSTNDHLNPFVNDIQEDNYLAMSSIRGSNNVHHRQNAPEESLYMSPTGLL